MTKYKQYFNEMIEQNQEVFNAFRDIHDKYVLNENVNQEEFNKIGKEIVDIVQKYENKLCAHSEGGVYGKYSIALADKFRDEVRKVFPKFDFIGVSFSSPDDDFKRGMKKISLN